jgi:co-chaperonin GroES (HSP10)
MIPMNLKPLRSVIYVKIEEPESKNGLLLSTNVTEPIARVVAVGPGLPTDEPGVLMKPPVAVGDKVLLLSNKIGKHFAWEGQEYQAIDETMIIGVVEETSIQ